MDTWASKEFVMGWVDKLQNQQLRPATGTSIGGVIVGSGLTVGPDGRIDVVFPSHVDYLTKTDASLIYATKQELSDLDLTGDYVPLIQDRNGGLSAVTVGERSTDGSDKVGVCSFSSGRGNIASGDYSHAAGDSVIARGLNSHAEGCTTKAEGNCSHAEGKYTEASGAYSHAAGYRAKAQQHAYAWNGVESDTAYESNGDGTYNINPANGIEGFYIGQKNLKTILSEEAPVPDLSGYAKKTDLEGFATEADLLAFYYPDGNVTSMEQITTNGIEYAVGDDGGAYVVKGEGLTGDVVLPWKVTIDGKEYKVTAIRESAFAGDFYRNNFNGFTAPITVKSIGKFAFGYYSSLTSVNLPSATSIGDEAFSGCGSLTSANLPLVKSIGVSAFSSCYALTSISIPAAISIGEYAFADCDSLTSVNLPSATSIGDGAFYYCTSLTTIDFGSSPKSAVPLLSEFVFYGVPTTCKFIIPLGMNDEWIAAPNWSDLYAEGYKFEGYASTEQVKDKRDKTDNIAAADSAEFTEWKFHCDVPEIQAALDENPPAIQRFSDPAVPDATDTWILNGLPAVEGYGSGQLTPDEPYDANAVCLTFGRAYVSNASETRYTITATRERTVLTKSGEPYVTPTGVKGIATGLVESARHELQGEISAVQSTADNALAMVEAATRDKGYTYKSPFFDELYDLSPVHTVAVNSSQIAVPCHKGWLIGRFYNRSAATKDYYIAPDGRVTFSDGPVFGSDSGSNNCAFHLAIVRPTETVVYATATGGAFVKTVVDAECNLRREILSELPFNLAEYLCSYGISVGNGFVATTAGVVLNEDTLEEVSVFSSIPLYSSRSISLRTWGSLEYSTKDGRYMYCDPSTKQLTKMKLDESGVLEFTVNSYKQPFDSTSYPLIFSGNDTSDWVCCAVKRVRCDGVLSPLGYNYDSGLPVVGTGRVAGVGRNKKFGYPVLCVGERLVLATRLSHNEVVGDVLDLIKDFVPRFEPKYWRTQDGYQSFRMVQDHTGNILCLRSQTYHWGNKQIFVILTEK